METGELGLGTLDKTTRMKEERFATSECADNTPEYAETRPKACGSILCLSLGIPTSKKSI